MLPDGKSTRTGWCEPIMKRLSLLPSSICASTLAKDRADVHNWEVIDATQALPVDV
jgi:hypothetical protein